jgi:hypothetical protein
MGREAPESEWGGVAMGGIGGGTNGSQPTGCPRHVIDAIPQIVFNKEQWEAGDMAKVGLYKSNAVAPLARNRLVSTLEPMK